MGRPSKYTPELAQAICEAIAETGSLARALETPGDWPAQGTVFRWIATDEGFRESYVRAHEAGSEPDAMEMRRVAYDPDVKPEDKRLQIDVLKWQMARRCPKKWGDRQILAGDPEAPLQGMSEQQVDDRLSALMAKFEQRRE